MIVSRALTIVLAGGLLLWAAQRTPAGPYVPPGLGEVQVLVIDPAAPGTAPVATPGGAKYSNLLRRIEVPNDRASYGDFYDWGYWSGTEWGGHTDLPTGYWVYVDGTWYIFGTGGGGDRDAPPVFAPAAPVQFDNGKRAWGPEQATGAPDTPQAGDIQTAWASATPDGQPEWLELTYDQAIDAVAVVVHETYNPGAVSKITVFDAEGNEHVVYNATAAPLTSSQPVDASGVQFLVPDYDGIEPLQPQEAGARCTLVAPIKAGFPTQKVKVYLDSAAVPGWNEIDAVGLIDAAGNMHWASGATASSSYAERTEQNVRSDETTGTIDLIRVNSPEERVRQLEEEVRRLQQEIQQLRDSLGLPWNYLGIEPAGAR